MGSLDKTDIKVDNDLLYTYDHLSSTIKCTLLHSNGYWFTDIQQCYHWVRLRGSRTQ